MSKHPKNPTDPIPRCRPRIDERISEIVATSLSKRSSVAAKGGDFHSVLASGVEAINQLAPELELAAEGGELLPLILSSLEVSYFTSLGWGNRADNIHGKAPTWIFQELFNDGAVDIQHYTGRPDLHKKSETLASVANFIDVFKAKHGNYGLQLLLAAIKQFIESHKKTYEVLTIAMRGAHAGENDKSNTVSFFEYLELLSICICLKSDDFVNLKLFARKGDESGYVSVIALDLMGSERVEEALRWLEMEPSNGNLGDSSEPHSIMNLRILAAQNLDDRVALLRHLTIAYRKTFARTYFSQILGLFTGADGNIIRTHLFNLAESAEWSLVSRAFELLLEEKAWISLERLQARYHGKAVELVYNVDSKSGQNKLQKFIKACQEHAPLVASHLRQLKKH